MAAGIAELTRNAVDVLPEGELERKLALGRPLRVKLGIDVTAPDVHVGHAIPLQRMAAFQRAGHVGVLIVGDYTTRIGDPSGRSTERPGPLRRGDRRERQALLRAGRRRSSTRRRPRCASTASGSRSSTSPRSSGSPGRSRSRGCSSATTSRSASRPRRRSRSPSSSIRSCRPTTRWRSRRTSSSAAPTSSTTCSPAATSCRRTGSSRRSR